MGILNDPMWGINKLGDTLFPDPTRKAQGMLDQIPGQMKKYYDPYIDAGKNSIPDYQETMRQLMMNPQELINKIAGSYQKSPGYDWNVKQGQSAVTNANAAGGLAGSPQHEQMSAEMTQGLASKDFNEYMDRMMQGLGLGAAGTGNIFNTGANMSSNLAEAIAKIMGDKAGLQYQGDQGKNDRNAQIMAMIGKVLGGM